MTYFISKKKVPNFRFRAALTQAIKFYFLQGESKSAVQKVSNHFEYLENRSYGLDVTWQLVRGDLTAHPWTVTLPWG
jgi:hypothetical protein